MNALVTGAGGFIGSHLVAYLVQRGHSVRALVHDAKRHDTWTSSVEVVVGDVLDRHTMKAAAFGCETIYHLAGKAHMLSEVQGSEDVYRGINTEGTRHVLEGAIAGGARAFVLFSSVKAMGEGGSRCLDESFDGVPETPYGRSKREAERLVLEVGRHARLHVTCLRLPLVYGPGNKGNLYRMIAAIDRGMFPPLQEVGNRRSLVHVADVVRAAVLAAETPVANGRCYIITSGPPYSTRELYVLINRCLGRQMSSWQTPLWMLKALAIAGDAIGRLRGKRCIFDSDALNKLVESAWYSSDAIARDLGYHPLMTFENAMPEIIQDYRSGLRQCS
ncbi:MAG: NAD-dependent epimerase/dehydratase family protein [Nitrospiraceae bacterium]|nr:NAD-dependent epimerase/dehydratase family protein [Nitrospiraceae bacterium]